MKKSIIAIIVICMCIIGILSFFLGYESINNKSLNNIGNTKENIDTNNDISNSNNTSNNNISNANKGSNVDNINNTNGINDMRNTNKKSNIIEVVNISIPRGEQVSISKNPYSNSDVITKLAGTYKIEILEKGREWDYIKVDGVEGYIPSNLVKAFINDYKNNVETSHNSQTIDNSSNNSTSNSIVANYFGNWKVADSIGHSIEGMTGNYPSMTGKNLKILSNIYEFDGVCINNPYYYVKKIDTRELFGEYGATGVLGNNNVLNVLFVSQQPLSNSEVNNLIPEDGLTPIIILYNSKVYIFGGGKNNSEIYSTYLM